MLYWGNVGVRLGLYWGNIGVILGFESPISRLYGIPIGAVFEAFSDVLADPGSVIGEFRV